MEEFKKLLEGYKDFCHNNYFKKMNTDPDYKYTDRCKRDINNNKYIWNSIDNFKTLQRTPELDKWAKGWVNKFMTGKIHSGVIDIWTMIDDMDEKFRQNDKGKVYKNLISK